MIRSSRSLIRSALALALAAAVAPAAQAAYQTPKRHHQHVYRAPVRQPGDIYVSRRIRSYLDPGPAPDYTDDLYFQDTAYPHYLLGPGIFQRLETSPGQYN